MLKKEQGEQDENDRQNNMGNMTCYFCGEKGHMSYNCLHKKKFDDSRKKESKDEYNKQVMVYREIGNIGMSNDNRKDKN